MGPIYNIIFNSANGTGATNAMSYNLDWGMLPEGKYKCKFSYTGKLNSQSYINLAKVYLDIGQSKQYEVVPSFQSSKTILTHYIGCLDSEIGLVPNTAIGTGTIIGNHLFVYSLTYGSFSIGQYITTSSTIENITSGTYITAYETASIGGVGSYILNQATPIASTVSIYGTNPPYSYLYCDTDTNPPFFLDCKPNNNIITCSIVNETGALWVDTLNQPPASYILTLSMELMT